MFQETRLSKTPVSTHKSTRRYNPEDSSGYNTLMRIYLRFRSADGINGGVGGKGGMVNVQGRLGDHPCPIHVNKTEARVLVRQN
jgi:hypothetical protein